MKARAWSVGIVLIALGLVEANQDSPYEQLLKQALESFDKIGMTLKTIVDEESADAAKPVLRKAADAFVEARAKAAKLEVPEKDEKTRLEKMYKMKLEESMKLMSTQARRVAEVPGGKDALKEIAGILKKDSK